MGNETFYWAALYVEKLLLIRSFTRVQCFMLLFCYVWSLLTYFDYQSSYTLVSFWILCCSVCTVILELIRLSRNDLDFKSRALCA